jgi:hypothetical protein
MLSRRDCASERNLIERRQRYRLSLLLFLWAGIIMGAVWASGKPEEQQDLTLSQGTPQAVFPLNGQRVDRGQTTVIVRLVRADNPDRADFTVTVALVDCSGGLESRSVVVGSLGTYPTAEVGGSYALDLGPGLKQMRATGLETRQICLKLELKPLRASVEWKNLRVIVTGPEWKEPPRA